MKKIRLAIDGNEANVKKRVGSNVYAFQLISELEKQMSADQYEVTVLLSRPALADLPAARAGWKYKVLKPSWLWTQLIAPLHLYLHPSEYDLYYTPGHYAPRLCPIPYISSVMDLAFLHYPDHFEQADRIKLSDWTRYSVKSAALIIAISQHTKQDIVQTYGIAEDKIKVAHPALEPTEEIANATNFNQFLNFHGIRQPYFLFLGTLQPRKNLVTLISAYEELCRRITTGQIQGQSQLPQLVLAGQTGWLSKPIFEYIHASPFFDLIITPGFIPTAIKSPLFSHSIASLLVGLYEGFGIPSLEALRAETIPIVSKTTSLPEVIGQAGYQVDPLDKFAIAQAMEKALTIKPDEKKALVAKGQKQLAKFSWSKSAQVVMTAISQVANEK